jgi:hypothetical protein
LPQAPRKPDAEPIAADALARRIDAFLASRGIPGSGATPSPSPDAPVQRTAPSTPAARVAAVQPAAPVPFVCEDDVRVAVREGRKILVGDKTIITPAARDAGEAAKVFVWPSYRS